MNIIKTAAVLLFTIFSVTGCINSERFGSFEEHRGLSGNIKKTVVPSDMDRSKFENRYPVPRAKAGQDNPSILPPRG